MPKPTITHFVLMGDSLSDRGRMDNENLLGIIPMSWVTGLDKNSPCGRFSNGFNWIDDLSADLANQFTINELKEKYGLSDADIADGIMNNNPRIKEALHSNYNLHDYAKVNFHGQDMIRTYTEGGLTSHSYRGVPSSSLPRFITRLILNSLSRMREKVFADDKAQNISADQKAHTLTIEWSGANDMITVNKRPSKEEADRAIKDRIKNVEQMLQHGYQRFVLFNMPDLSLTPRYQAMRPEEQKNARECSAYFNEQLAQAVKKINAKYPDATVEVFDVATKFTDVYNHPEKYGFEKAKLTQPYVKSTDFNIKPDHTSPAPGYMFWDDVHPSALMQSILSEQFLDAYKNKYHYAPPDGNITHDHVNDLEITAPMMSACA